MISSGHRRVLLVIAIVIGTFLYFAAGHYLEKKDQKNSVTVYQKGAGGLSVFLALRGQAKPGNTTINRVAVLNDRVLASSNAVLMFAPRAPISRREAKMLRNYVDNGGILFLSFHTDAHFANLSHLFASLELSSRSRRNDSFTNGVAEVLSPAIDTQWFVEKEKYGLYAPVIFDDEECANGRFFCFVKQKSIGKGQAIVFAGLPPLTNTLVGVEANRELAFRMIKNINLLTIDEFHHFFSEKTFGDLLMEPAFILPLGGMVLAAILFFLFARTEFHERSLVTQESHPALSHHEVAERIAMGALSQKGGFGGALALHLKLLKQRFPNSQDRISKVDTSAHAPDVARNLIRLHQQLLREKGRTP